MIPIIMAAFIWGRGWKGKIIKFFCDNESVVFALNKLYSPNEKLVHLIRCLVFVAAKHGFWFRASHIAGVDNTLADALSRNNMALFLAQAPKGMKLVPDPIPQEIP